MVGRAGRAAVGLAALVVLAGLGSSSMAAAQPQPPPPTPPPSRPPVTAPPPTPPPSRPPTTPPPPSQPTTIPAAAATAPPDADESGGGNGAALVLAALAGAAIAGGLAVVGLRGRARAGPRSVPAPPAPATTGSPAPGALTHELLEVSRQLTAASVTGDVKRATVRGALSLVPADGAALLTVDDDTALTIAVESTPDLLVPEHLGDGVLGRVVETGDHVELISASEPAIRNRPACVLAMPLVAGGRVAAVLVVVRAKDLPFTPNETRTLRALAPMAAAVLQSERHAQSAIEDSLVDPLTGANNRRRFDRDLPATLERATEAGTALAIVDLDHFKRVNDTHGHPAGDALLEAVVATIQRTVRPGDGVYRFGGEEFCILFPDTNGREATDVADRVRAAIAAAPFDIGAAEPLSATASIGVASTTAHDGPRNAADLLARADAALYAAKEGGRNRVVAG